MERQNHSINFDELVEEAEDDLALAMTFFNQMDMGIEFNLPVKVSKHTATRVENNGRRLIWDFDLNENSEIFFEMRVLKLSRVISLSLIIVVIMGVILSIKSGSIKEGF